jgi:hypothetical protein
MKSLPSGVDLSKLSIRSSLGVNENAIANALKTLMPLNLSAERLTDAERIPDVAPKKKGRAAIFGRSRKVELDGYRFDSEGEAELYLVHKAELAAGAIRDLLVHPTFPLVWNDILVYTYTADFSFYRRGSDKKTVEDYKSEYTLSKDTWRIVKKMMIAAYRQRVTVITKKGER